VERLGEYAGRDAEAAEEFLERLARVEGIAALVNLGEERRVHLVELAERLGRVERPGMEAQQVVPHRRNPHEADPAGLRLEPAGNVGLEVVAVRTAVPEELRDLDLLGARARRLRRR